MDLGLKKCCDFLKKYRKTGSKIAILRPKDLTEILKVPLEFKATTRIRSVKCQDVKTPCDEPITSPEQKLEA